MHQVVAVISPCNVAEALYGKAVLLTDTMIAQLLDVLKLADAVSEIGQEAVDELWSKLVLLFSADVGEAERIKHNERVGRAVTNLERAISNIEEQAA